MAASKPTPSSRTDTSTRPRRMPKLSQTCLTFERLVMLVTASCTRRYMLGELVHQNLKGLHQPQVGQRRRSQVFDDAASQRNAAVERVDQVRDQPRAVRRLVGQFHLDADRVELGRGKQRSQFVMQVVRQATALVFASRLQLAGQLEKLCRALRHLDFQAISVIPYLSAAAVSAAASAHASAGRVTSRLTGLDVGPLLREFAYGVHEIAPSLTRRAAS